MFHPVQGRMDLGLSEEYCMLPLSISRNISRGSSSSSFYLWQMAFSTSKQSLKECHVGIRILDVGGCDTSNNALVHHHPDEKYHLGDTPFSDRPIWILIGIFMKQHEPTNFLSKSRATHFLRVDPLEVQSLLGSRMLLGILTSFTFAIYLAENHRIMVKSPAWMAWMAWI